MATKLEFLKNMAVGDIVAFRCKGKMLSAKVVKIESEVQLSPKNEEYDVVLVPSGREQLSLALFFCF